jgi:hypothetical protein
MPVALTGRSKPSKGGPLYRFMISNIFRKNDPCQEKYLKNNMKKNKQKNSKKRNIIVKHFGFVII